MVALSPPPVDHQWGNLSFVSTLYLCPILDQLLARVPHRWRPEVRLGLQEALVNAVKHGNQLDQQKVISVRYTVAQGRHWWVIADQGGGFDPPCGCHEPPLEAEPAADVGDCGRGLYILHQVFDEVRWVSGGRELHLCKHVRRWFQLPRIC